METKRRDSSTTLRTICPSAKLFASAPVFPCLISEDSAARPTFSLTPQSAANLAAPAKRSIGPSRKKPRRNTKLSLPAASHQKTSAKRFSPSAPTPLMSPAASNPAPASKTPANSATSSPKSPAPTAPSFQTSQSNDWRDAAVFFLNTISLRTRLTSRPALAQLRLKSADNRTIRYSRVVAQELDFARFSQ